MLRAALFGALVIGAVAAFGATRLTTVIDNGATAQFAPIAAAHAAIARSGDEAQTAGDAASRDAAPRLPGVRAEPAQTPIRVAVRCGTSNYYCNPPTPFCCGTPGKYFCAKDAAACAQVPPPRPGAPPK